MSAKISIKSVLKKVAEPILAEHGFRPIKVVGSGVWTFKREVESCDQLVTFQKSNFVQGLRIDFTTSIVRGRPPVEGMRFFPGRYKSFWEYQDEESLVQVVHELVQIFLDHGLACLELMSQPDLKPAIELERELLRDPESRAQGFIEQFGLELGEPEHSLRQLQELLLKRKGESDGVDWEFILGASAYYGELVRKNLGGVWEWHDKLSECVVDNVRGVGVGTIPLRNVAYFWNKPNMVGYSLIEQYASLK